MIVPGLYFAPVDSHGGLLMWLFGNGIGTNIGASLIWGFIAGFVGYLVAKKVKAAWARLHQKIDAHRNESRQQLRSLHERHDAHAENLAALAGRVEDLHVKLDARPVARVATRKATAKPTVKRPAAPRAKKA